MSRLESLKKIREVLETVPDDQLGEGQFFARGLPCCSLGHAIARIPGARDVYGVHAPDDTCDAAAFALGITVSDVYDLTDTNDRSKGADRKISVLGQLLWKISEET